MRSMFVLARIYLPLGGDIEGRRRGKKGGTSGPKNILRCGCTRRHRPQPHEFQVCGASSYHKLLGELAVLLDVRVGVVLNNMRPGLVSS